MDIEFLLTSTNASPLFLQIYKIAVIQPQYIITPKQ